MCTQSKCSQEEEVRRRRGVGGVHPNQSNSSPPAPGTGGTTDFCMQTHSRSQLEPSLPGADKDSPRAARSASLTPAASAHTLPYREALKEKHK